jgi:inward rectifier potassium channel
LSIHKRKIENIDNTGFAASSSVEGARLTNKDGTVNLKKTGLQFWEHISLYHTLLRMHRAKFFLSIVLFYGSLNLFFAFLYVINGVEHLKGVEIIDGKTMSGFLQAFFFSSQTLTTVGYGHVSPEGLGANVLAALESFLGILAFALVTGLLYGRFTRPKAFLKFSENGLIAPHKGKHAFMCRMATYKNNHLTDVEAQLTVAFHINESGSQLTRFYPMKLEISRVNSLALSWTVVHLIDEDSPLYQMTHEDMKNAGIEVLVFVKGFDDHFSNTVQQRTSYSTKEIVYGGKFIPMFRRSADGRATILEVDKIDAFERVKLPDSSTSAVNA